MNLGRCTADSVAWWLDELRRRNKSNASTLKTCLFAVILLLLGMLVAGSVGAQDQFSAAAEPEKKTVTELRLYGAPQAKKAYTGDKVFPPNSAQSPVLAFAPENTEIAKTLEAILQAHFRPSEFDPVAIKEDLTAIAHYFSRYPETTELILSLADSNWSLNYRRKTFKSDVIGSRLSVDSVNIYFDPRVAAKLKFHNACADKKPLCIASPADALIHELLHAQSALLYPGEFLHQGGMNGVLYPFTHERKIIESENALYQAMSEIDGHHRPIRRQHVGRYVKTGCVTCIQ